MIRQTVMYLFIFLLILAHMGCKTKTEEHTAPKSLDDHIMMNTNRIVTVSEESIIDDYIKRYQWKMNKTGSGLRYMIYKTTSGKKTGQGDVVTLNYSLELINGQPCYSSANDGPKKFIIGKSTVERGLEEGVLLMKKGERAKFILPSHLGNGFQGDMRKIPKKAILIYDVELVDVIQLNNN